MASTMMPSSPPRRSHQSGAFDLPSVLIGVAVVAILAIGAMAAVFGVIPWAQDRAAQQDLAAVNTAQGTTYAHGGSFTGKAALVGAGWLGEGTPAALDTKADADGKCYVAVTTSRTGNKFVVSNDMPTPRPLAGSDTWCNGVLVTPDPTPVMVSTWDTTLAASCKEITLPLTGFKGTVSWGDGTTDNKITHTFATAGESKIQINGTFTGWGGPAWSDASCLRSVDRWGSTGTTNLTHAFSSAVNLKHVESIPATTTSLVSAFYQATSDFTLGHWDTGNVTSMYGLFWKAASFNQPVSFDTGRVTDMTAMFEGAVSFNQPVSFDTSQVTRMYQMFFGAKAFDQPVEFDTSKVTTMASMFNGAAAFNHPVGFNTSKVTTMASMFFEANTFNQPINFNTDNVTEMSYMFIYARAFNQPVAFSSTAEVTTMLGMFNGASSFNQPLEFDTSKVTAMGSMFLGATVFNQDLSSWKVAHLSPTSRSLFDGDTPAWNLPKPSWSS